MVSNPYAAPAGQPFPWKLFLLVVFVVGSLATAAIVLTLIANPPHGSLHIPTLQPMTRLSGPSSPTCA